MITTTVERRRPIRRLSARDRRQLVVEACAELIATRGYAAMNLRDVAAAAGISIGTLHHHFQGKDNLLAETLIYVSEQFHNRARQASLTTQDPSDRLRRMVHSAFDGSEAQRGWRVWLAFWNEAIFDLRLGYVANARNDVWESLLASAIADVICPRGRPPSDAQYLALELATIINGVAIQLYAERSRLDRKEALAMLDDMLNRILSE
jgi:AcrR family transcriptional regulator